ncbi:MAG TPA: SprT family zinc-dependent metalloprotease [Ignavibacteria bacterium]|nr:SprT family zinc-dependent metalloprotease [Ignavibacteria bacterium]HMR41181.1 SprT family zinc-dependent metalloprotease [Ignavibacteria bacterium]
MKDYIQFGSKKIKYQLEYSGRKSLGITVKPDLKVIVKAPENVLPEQIKEKLLKKAPWILKQQSFFLTYHPKTPPKKFIGGETHLYLGRQYILKILKSKEELVHINGNFLEVKTRDRTRTRLLVTEWYLQNARIKFENISKRAIEKFKKYKVKPDSIVIRYMPTRWGSCTPKGKIILNPELIKAPRGCIEYVIVHELCHLVHLDHTQKFIDLQTKVMPDWEKWKMRLERILA